jgi:hypothetical protein
MTHIILQMNAEGLLEGVPKEKIIFLEGPITIGALEGGMESGAPSVAFVFKLPDGRHVLAETSMLLFQSAAAAFRAKFNTELPEVRHTVKKKGTVQ